VPQPGLFSGAIDIMSPSLAEHLRATWEAVNNGWNQWVLSYTQSRQLNLLKNIGFEAPSLQDLAYVLLGLLVATSLGGAGWALWERRRHDPWLRLLGRARVRLLKAGLALPDTAPPRQMAAQARAQLGPRAEPVHNWLLKLEAQRYAKAAPHTLAVLRAEFRRLQWPP
jgi:hypothetical protein